MADESVEVSVRRRIRKPRPRVEVLSCPLCAWTIVQREVLPDGDPLPPGLFYDLWLADRMTDALDRHLGKHPPKVWYPALMQARREAHR